MGLLKRHAPPKPTGTALTIIAEGNKFSGEMNIVGKMHIDGVFEGTVNSLDLISVGRQGAVYGKIRARQISVCGLLEGEIVCEQLRIEPGGRVRGQVLSEEMSVDPKGCFVGERRLREKKRETRPGGEGGPAKPLDPAFADLPDKVVLDKR